MSVNDVLTVGARPILFLDYVAVGRLLPAEMAQIVAGVAEGCRQAGCALVGGEMAEMPGLYAPGEFDLAGFCVGLAERAKLIDGSHGRRRATSSSASPPAASTPTATRWCARCWRSTSVRPGRHLPRHVARPSPTPCCAPTRIYVQSVLRLLDEGVPVRAMAHITGGGMIGNLSRVIPDGLSRASGLRRVEDPAAVPGHPEPGRHRRRGDVRHLQHGRRLRAGGPRGRVAPRPRAADGGGRRGHSSWAEVVAGPRQGDAGRACCDGEPTKRLRRAPADAAPVFRIAVLASGSGSNLQAIIDQLHRPRFQVIDADERRAVRRAARRRARSAAGRPRGPAHRGGPGDQRRARRPRSGARATRAGIRTAVHPGRRLSATGRSTTWPWSTPALRGGARPGGAGRLHAHRVAVACSRPSPGGSSTCTRRCCRRFPGTTPSATPCATGSR